MKKTLLVIAGICLALVGCVLGLNWYSSYSTEKQAVEKVYDKCMNDELMRGWRSNGEMETFCQCTAKLTHESHVDFQEAMDSLVILSLSDAQAPLTPDNRLNIGILYYCDGVALND